MFMIISPLRPYFLCFIAKFSLNLFVNDCSTVIYKLNNDITSILDITVMKTAITAVSIVKSCIYKIFINEDK